MLAFNAELAQELAFYLGVALLASVVGRDLVGVGEIDAAMDRLIELPGERGHGGLLSSAVYLAALEGLYQPRINCLIARASFC